MEVVVDQGESMEILLLFYDYFNMLWQVLKAIIELCDVLFFFT